MDRAKLLNKMAPAEFVLFDFNPASVAVTKELGSGLDAASIPSASSGFAGNMGLVFRGTKPTKLTITDAILDGADTKPRADLLLGFMSPGGGLLGKLVGAAVATLTGRPSLATQLPTLVFQWGPPVMGFSWECTMASLNVNYVRFGPDGIPSRAKVTMSLMEQPSLLGISPTNPTSGGIAGRERHVVVEGESLVTIAQRTYGNPRAWRPLAAANGIDDPFRVSPGTVVYLPAYEELANGAR